MLSAQQLPVAVATCAGLLRSSKVTARLHTGEVKAQNLENLSIEKVFVNDLWSAHHCEHWFCSSCVWPRFCFSFSYLLHYFPSNLHLCFWWVAADWRSVGGRAHDVDSVRRLTCVKQRQSPTRKAELVADVEASITSVELLHAGEVQCLFNACRKA